MVSCVLRRSKERGRFHTKVGLFLEVRGEISTDETTLLTPLKQYNSRNPFFREYHEGIFAFDYNELLGRKVDNTSHRKSFTSPEGGNVK